MRGPLRWSPFQCCVVILLLLILYLSSIYSIISIFFFYDILIKLPFCGSFAELYYFQVTFVFIFISIDHSSYQYLKWNAKMIISNVMKIKLSCKENCEKLLNYLWGDILCKIKYSWYSRYYDIFLNLFKRCMYSVY